MPDKCPICLEELLSSICTITPCGHCFHRSCLQSLTNALHNDPSNQGSSSKLPRCPVCKHKSKKFVPLYLTFEKEDPVRTTNNANSNADVDANANATNNISDTSTITAVAALSDPNYNDATEAVRSLSTHNFQLQKNILELKSLSKDQSDILLEVLPKFDTLESKLRQISREKHLIEKQLLDVEAENADLISDWNEVEMKMQLLQTEKNELRKENTDLSMRRTEVDEKLVKAKRKRKRIEEALRDGFEDHQVQARELEVVKDEIVKSQVEKERLSCLLKESQLETDKLRKKVKKLKRMCRVVSDSSPSSSGSSSFSSFPSSRVKKSMKLYKERSARRATRTRTRRALCTVP
jgi:hypothetical protein